MDHGWLSQRRREATAVYDPMTLSPSSPRKPLRTRLRLVVSTLPRRLPWLLLLLLLLCGIWALLVHTSRTPASDLAHSSSGAQQRDHVAGKAHRRTSGAVAGSGAEVGTEEELNMEEDEADSSGALDAAAAAAQLAEVRRQVAAVEQRVRAGELPEEVQTTLDVAPEPISRNQHPVIRFSADREVAEFKVQIDDDAWAPARSPLRFHRALAEGPHTLRVVAVDLHGRADPTPAAAMFRIDLTAPTLVLERVPSEFSNLVTAPFTVCADEDQCEMRWSLDVPYVPASDDPQVSEEPGERGAEAKQRWTAATALEAAVEVNRTSARCTALRVPGLTAGVFRFRVAAKDLAGNMAQPRTVVWRVDLSPPQTQLLAGPRGTLATRGAALLLRAPGEPAGTYSFQYRYDWYPNQPHPPRLRNGPRRDALAAESSDWVTGSQWSSDEAKLVLVGDSLTMAQLPEGPHKLEVRAVDAARNVDPTPVVLEFIVHVKLPETLFVEPPPHSTCGPQARFKVACSNSQCMYEHKLDGHGWKWVAGETLSRGALELELDHLSQGKHHLQVRSTDATGEREAKALSFKWLVGVCFNLPPSFAVPPPVVERSDAAAPDGTAERESGDSGSSAGAEAEEEDVLEEEDRLAAAVFEAMKPKQHEDLVASPTRPKAIEWRGGHVRNSEHSWAREQHAGRVTGTNSFHDVPSRKAAHPSESL